MNSLVERGSVSAGRGVVKLSQSGGGRPPSRGLYTHSHGGKLRLFVGVDVCKQSGAGVISEKGKFASYSRDPNSQALKKHSQELRKYMQVSFQRATHIGS
ncbi:hypothetical protein GOP47_0019308 [Adiantum capillus-veneris]|uniref:Uncharacterized protein n=1 Tax=Adiantum capillus-veneris TaxID=13818 RepID=A0A9D4Z9I1_ADICA|nr:hypothetical protein GOP47_0019308 [Adiantum capillus-veneris]